MHQLVMKPRFDRPERRQVRNVTRLLARPLSQPQHDPEHQEGKEHTLCRMENDRHPCTPIAIGRVSVQKSGDNRVQYSRGLVNVIKSEEYSVCHPTAASENTFHLGQQYAPKEKLPPRSC